jgi:hypothetical protein
MRGLFTLIGFLVCAALIVGYFRGWYTITSHPTENGHVKYQIDVNTQKAKEDVSKGTKAAVNAVTPAKTNTAQNPAPPSNAPPSTWTPATK